MKKKWSRWIAIALTAVLCLGCIPCSAAQSAAAAPDLTLLTDGPIRAGDTFQISWSAVSGADAYKVEVFSAAGALIYAENVVGETAMQLRSFALGTCQIRVTPFVGEEAGTRSDALAVEILEAPAAPCATHTYTSAGGDYCTVCGARFQPAVQPMQATVYALKNNVPVRDSCYAQTGATVGHLAQNAAATVTGALVNALGRTWYVLADGTYGYSEHVTAEPRQTTYSLRFDANGGANAPMGIGGSCVAVPTSPIPTRIGHLFLGYAPSASATDAVYQPGEKIALTRDMTLYALWANVAIPGNAAVSQRDLMDAEKGCPQHYLFYDEDGNNVGTPDDAESRIQNPGVGGRGLCTSAAATTLIQRMETTLTGQASTFTFEEFRRSGNYVWSGNGTYTGGTPEDSYTFSAMGRRSWTPPRRIGSRRSRRCWTSTRRA